MSNSINRPQTIRYDFRPDKQSHWEFFRPDNGIGIEPDAHDKIFVIFQRLNYAPDIACSGMGLADKKIIEWQGGKIWVELNWDLGSTLFILHCRETELI